MPNAPDQKPLYAGILTAGGITVWIIRSNLLMQEKVMYIAMLSIAAFTAGIIRFFLILYERYTIKHGEALTRLLEDHGTQTHEHEEMCNLLQSLSHGLTAEHETRLSKEHERV